MIEAAEDSVLSSGCWDIKKTARLLSVHEQTIRRMISSGELASLRLGRAIRIPVSEIEKLLDHRNASGDNESRAGSVMPGVSICHISAREVRTGGYRSPIQTVNELDALLERCKRRKR